MLGEEGACSHGRRPAESHRLRFHLNEDRVMQMTREEVSGERAAATPRCGHFEVSLPASE